VLLAEAIAGNLAVEGRGSRVAYRTGTGYDLHRLVPGRRLVIGGITVDSTVVRSVTPTPTWCAMP
jgi:2-C-methyl-D-erythritol 4-phosphate cytidylyltransferase/2-C-methyl-D-erythritol 2,4-cyclodiphosphate synthase